MFRHGDLLIRPIAAIPEGAKREKRKGDIILALGEATGHAHRIKTPGAMTWILGDTRYLVAPAGGAALTHEEHAAIVLPAGAHEIIPQRVYRPHALPERVVD